MGMMSEFKEFAMKGSMIDMAVGIIIGGAIGKVVASLVADVIMPPIGQMMGGVNFTDLKHVLSEAVMENGEVVTEAVSINYGSFIQTVIDFLIIAFVIFLMIRQMNKMKKEEPAAAPPEPSKEETLLTEIRDALKK